MIEENNQNDLKILNYEKVLEFKANQDGFDEAEISLKNESNKNSFLCKIYINNYTHFKCQPNIINIPQSSSAKIKVLSNDINYKISESDIFLILSLPIEDESSLLNKDNKQLDIFFKDNGKDKMVKLFLIGNKKEKEKQLKKDEYIEKIKNLEKEVFEKQEKEQIEPKSDKKDVNPEPKKILETKTNLKNTSSSSKYTLLVFSLIIISLSILLFKILKK